jgi:hypothetical protein
MNNNIVIRWLTDPEDKDYSAAESYLNLLFDETTGKDLVKRLMKTSKSQFKAKDIFRASGLSLLGISNSHIEKDRKKIKMVKSSHQFF